MELSNLQKIKIIKEAKRLGRGHSSGKGKTSGRGQKGQKARGKVPVGFEGGQTPLYKRVPFVRGKGMKQWSVKSFGVNVGMLNTLKPGTEVTIQSLIEHGIVRERAIKNRGVKILGGGELTTKLIVILQVTANAKQKIEAAQGTVS